LAPGRAGRCGAIERNGNSDRRCAGRQQAHLENPVEEADLFADRESVDHRARDQRHVDQQQNRCKNAGGAENVEKIGQRSKTPLGLVKAEKIVGETREYCE
jgi:hypothetical protein